MTMILMWKVVLVVDRGVYMQPKLLVLAIKLHQFANQQQNQSSYQFQPIKMLSNFQFQKSS